MRRKEFEALVRRAVEELPEEFRKRMGELAIVVSSEPTKAERSAAGVPRGDELFGLFQGAAVTEQGLDDLPRLPDRIVIYQRPLERSFPDKAELAAEIRATLLHEAGHYFGLEEEDLDRLGWG